MSKINNIDKELVQKLSSVYDYKDFVINAAHGLKNDIEKKAVIEYIDERKNISPEIINLFVLDIRTVGLKRAIQDFKELD